MEQPYNAENLAKQISTRYRVLAKLHKLLTRAAARIKNHMLKIEQQIIDSRQFN